MNVLSGSFKYHTGNPKKTTGWWLNQTKPSEKYWVVKLDHFSQFSGWTLKNVWNHNWSSHNLFPTICFASPSQLPRCPGARRFQRRHFPVCCNKIRGLILWNIFTWKWLLPASFLISLYIWYMYTHVCTKHSEAVNTVIDCRLTSTFKMGYSNIPNL